MDYVESYLNKFQITGITVRTSNRDGKAPNDIGLLWKQFFDDKIFDIISNRVSDDIYCAYFDYSGENKEDYTAILGCKTEGHNENPENLTVKSFPTSKYFVYRALGKLPQSVIEAWNFIYQENLIRTYSGDFDLYTHETFGGENSETLIHVAIKDY